MLDTLQTYVATALESEFFVGGLALGLLGLAAGVVRLVWRGLSGLCLRRLTVTVMVDNRVAEFLHLLDWLDHSGALGRARRFRLTWIGGRGAQRASFAPALGVHWFVLDGQLVQLHREMSDKARTGKGTPLETLTLTLPLGRRKTIERWIVAGAELDANRSRIGPTLHIFADGYWTQAGEVVHRPVSSLVAEDDRVATMLEDLRWFYGARDWYVDRGVPWRRGYLLHGPPGTGKSSAIRAAASELGLGLAILDLGRRTLTDDQLCEALVQAPEDAVLVFEDIDAAFIERAAGEVSTGISFSGLLNALDGVAAQEGRALFMTTNHLDRLDPALIRPGRADVHLKLGLVGAEQAALLFLRFFPEETALADRFRNRLGDRRYSPAELQGWLLAHASDAPQAAEADGLTPKLTVAAE
ncbi:MAG: AAA family ATPase [Silicimonas sp.]|nr:AAA family ATPase [Silicimonas sp.]